MGIFEVVRREISPLEALQYYGLHPIKKGKYYWLLCPFHIEKHPSMLINETQIHCFGCGWHGGIVDFVAEYFRLQPLEAAKKLSEDFGIPIEEKNPKSKKRKAFLKAQEKRKEEVLYQAYLKAVNETFQFLADLNILYTKIKASVNTPADFELEGVVGAYHNQELVNYWLDILTDGTPHEKLQVIQEVGAWIQKQK